MKLKYSKKEVIADWKIGSYTEESLAYKHRVSRSTIHNLVKNTDKTIKPLITKQVEINQEVAKLNNEEITLFNKEVDEQTKNLEFFKNHTMTNIEVMMKKVDENIDISDHKNVQATIRDGKETIFGKTPEIVVSNINQQQQSTKIDLSSATEREQDILMELLEGRQSG